MQKKIIYGISPLLLVALVAFTFWPKQSQAECQARDFIYPLHNPHLIGIEDKYVGADKFYLVVDVKGYGELPDELHKTKVTKIAKGFLEKRLLPCTGHSEVEVLNFSEDEKLHEENVLIAYVSVTYLKAIPELSNSTVGYRPNTAMIRARYHRTGAYKRIGAFKRDGVDDSLVGFLSLDRDDDKFNDHIKRVIERVLKLRLKYVGTL